ncbi:MAG: SWIM zinc finger family protein [Myxococcaceae bacterium]|nr:SWIM zinc finger family protein [Myxococcaceae bacterium]
MIPFTFTYATPSTFESTRTRALFDLQVDLARPVRFHAKVSQHVLPLRFALQALGQLIWHSDEWTTDFWTLDPIVTVHPDRVFFEAFSADQSSYGLVIADRALFSPEGDVACGTTNVDFTAWLWAALAEMRTTRDTFFRVGPEGFEVRTSGAGGRFEQKVEVPEAWVRGFLQLQGAMAMPGTRLSLRPVDLLAAVRTLSHMKAKMSPRALRYELEPGRDAELVLEPWETRVPLRGASHSFGERRVIRTWGRRRLRLLEPLLPWAERVDVYLKGRALPSFYDVHLPGVRFVLGLSGWSANRWTDSASFDLLVNPSSGDAALAERVVQWLAAHHVATTEAIAGACGVGAPEATRALASLCAAGRVMFDVEARAWRYRELFQSPPDLAKLYPPDPRREEAAGYVARGEVALTSTSTRETTKHKRFKTPDGELFKEVVYRDWVVLGRVGPQAEVELVLNDEDRLIFGRCRCAFFDENLMNRGPCAHLLALLQVAQPQRRDLQSARESSAEAVAGAPPAEPARPRTEDEGPARDEDDDEDADDVDSAEETDEKP